MHFYTLSSEGCVTGWSTTELIWRILVPIIGITVGCTIINGGAKTDVHYSSLECQAIHRLDRVYRCIDAESISPTTVAMVALKHKVKSTLSCTFTPRKVTSIAKRGVVKEKKKGIALVSLSLWAQHSLSFSAYLFRAHCLFTMESNLFSPHLVRGLTDKIYEKRKAAALIIEK